MQQYHPSLYGATTACTLRGVDAMHNCGQEGPEAFKQDTFIGDSWFASVQTAEQVFNEGHQFIGIVKNGHKNFPKSYLEAKMKTWPGGTSLVMASTSANGIALVAIGYQGTKM